MRDVTIPLELFFAQQIKSGHLPIWNPDIAFGFPVLASAQIGVYYPPSLLGRLLPTPVYLPLLFLVHLAAAGCGMWYFLRHHNFSKQASLFGAASFMLSGFLWEHTTHLNIFFAYAYFPWQLLYTAILVKKSRLTAIHFIGAAFLFGMPLLIGQFQIQTFIGLTCIAYALAHRAKSMRMLAGTLSAVIIITIGAALLSSAQLLPTAELAQQSSRSTGGQFSVDVANQHSFPIYHLPTLIFPRFFGSDDTYWGKRLEIEYGIFIGTLPIILSLAYLGKSRPYHRHMLFFVWLLPISFLLALGAYSPIRLIGIEPSLWIFSAPTRWLGIAVFCLCVLAAAGFQYTLQTISFKSWVRLLVTLGIIVIAGNIALRNTSFMKTTAFSALQYLHHQKDQAYYEDKLAILEESAIRSSISLSSPFTYLPLLAIGAAAFFRSHKQYASIIIFATAAELLIIAATTTPTLAWTDILRTPVTLSRLPENVMEGQARIYSIRQGGDNGGYLTDPRTRANAPIRAQQRELLVPLISSQFGIPGIEWPASLDIKEVHATLAKLRGDEGYEIKDTGLLHELNIGAILSPDGNNAVHIETFSPAPRAELIDSANQKTALSYRAISPTEITLEVSSPTPGKVVIRDLFYPGWHAFVDEQEVPISFYAPFFRSVPVPDGNHMVTMAYRPMSIALGIKISLVTFFAFCIMLIFSYKRTIAT